MSAPPTSGPTATAPPIVAPQAAIALPRSAPWNSWAIRASEVANIAAPPMPCRPRATCRKIALVASPQSSDASVNSPTPSTNSRRRPKRSARVPMVRVKADSISV